MGIKNNKHDKDRKGFVVELPPGFDPKLDLIACLKHYLISVDIP